MLYRHEVRSKQTSIINHSRYRLDNSGGQSPAYRYCDLAQ
nr:MAG TPA: hypothetical protein [Caudoviricetes sp.]DAQ99405.1 MAG TPA: hypothetical protein [Caudoviricetes sp.]